MLRHVVMFRRRPGIEPDAVADEALQARMQALGAQVPGIRHWRLAANEINRPGVTWDLILEAEVDDVHGLQAYLTHPLHRALVADLSLRFEWVAVDYTV